MTAEQQLKGSKINYGVKNQKINKYKKMFFSIGTYIFSKA